MKAQFKMADRADAAFVAILGDQELADGTVTLRRLVDGVQKSVPAADVVRWLTRLDDWMDRDDRHAHGDADARLRRSCAPSDDGAEVALCGWVAHRRDHGGVTFIDLRDREGVVQLVFHPEDAPEAHAAAQALGAEDVVRVTGVVRAAPRRHGATRTSTPARSRSRRRRSRCSSASDTPPFPIEDRIEADEDLRLKYRYLDLRRPEMTQMLRLRHRVIRTIREYLDERGFVEIETPILTRSTPEGARDFLVPSRLFPGAFYALPQSPQQLKQLLMVAGQDRYYQIVRCFRDEDLARRSRLRVHAARPRDVLRRRGGHLLADGAAVRAARARAPRRRGRRAVPADDLSRR